VSQNENFCFVPRVDACIGEELDSFDIYISRSRKGMSVEDAVA
jgi:hypothetical protein